MMHTTKRGFTLLETVIVIGLLIAAMAALALMYLNFSSLYTIGQTTATHAIEARTIIDAVGSLTIPATTVVASRVFSTGTYTTDATTLVVELPSIDSTGAVLIGKYDYAVIYTSSYAAYQRIEADAASARRTGTKQLSQASTTLAFSFDSVVVSDIATVTASTTVTTLRKGIPTGTTLISTFHLRNH